MYVYTAVDDSGKKLKGKVPEEALELLEEELQEKGYYLVDLKPAGPIDLLLSWFRESFKNLTLKVTRKELIEFSRNLSVMLKAGVPLLVALEDIAGEVENKGFKEILSSMVKDLRAGASLSQCFRKHPKVFPPIFEKLTLIGEETGRLDETFKEISDHLERVEELVSSIKRAVMYPIFVVVTTIGSLIFWFSYVLPKIIALFHDMNVTLPPITLALVSISNFMNNYWWVVIIGILIPVVTGFLMTKWRRTKYYIDLLLLKIPIVKLIVYNGLIAATSENLRLLVAAGIGIDRVLSLTMESVGSEVMRRALQRVRERVLSGESLSNSFRKEKIFPAFFTRMVATGEASGNLDEQLGYVADFYFERLADVSEKLGKMLEPILIAVVGTIFAFIMVALFLPIYDLVSKAGMR